MSASDRSPLALRVASLALGAALGAGCATTGDEGFTADAAIVGTTDDAAAPECGTTAACGPHSTCAADADASCACEPGFDDEAGACGLDAIAGARLDMPCAKPTADAGAGDAGAGDAATDDASGPPKTCTALTSEPVVVPVGGVLGKTYGALVRIRGVVEQKTYTGGTNDGAFFQVGGAPADDGDDVFAIEVSDPPQTYYLNRGTSGLGYSLPVDYQATIAVAAGASVKLWANPIDGVETANVDDQGKPSVVPDVPPAPKAFDGQFLQIDLVSVAEMPKTATPDM